jgi:hypothetical protein
MGDIVTAMKMGNSRVTAEQKQLLIAAYQRTGNMSLAVRESGIGSRRIGYLWWNRYQALGEAGLLPRTSARKSQKLVDPALATEVCQLAEELPGGSRRGIADEMAKRYARRIISPSSVERILKKAGLWYRASGAQANRLEIPTLLRDGTVDTDLVLQLIHQGVQLDFSEKSAAAAAMLDQQVWQPLLLHHLMSKLIRDPRIGPQLLLSRVRLGHSLMNTGDWLRAVEYIETTLDWIRENIEEERRRWPLILPGGATFVIDDIWLDCLQTLGILRRDSIPEQSEALLTTANNRIGNFRNPLNPTGPVLKQGNLERDMARGQLRRKRGSRRTIEGLLKSSAGHLEEFGAFDVLAVTYMTEAKMHLVTSSGDLRRASDLEPALKKIEAALTIADRGISPMLDTICSIDAGAMTVPLGIDVYRGRLEKAAQRCLTFGYAGQARELLAIPGIAGVLSEQSVETLKKRFGKGQGRPS